jgi:NH3-dependent NAD+ synthetase
MSWPSLLSSFLRRKSKQSDQQHRKVLGLSLGINMVLVSILCVMAIVWGKQMTALCNSVFYSKQTQVVIWLGEAEEKFENP